MEITPEINITQEDNMELIARYDDNHFDLAIVDPPYGIGYAKNAHRKSNKIFGKSKALTGTYKNKEWDGKAPKKDYFSELLRVSKQQIIWGANHFIDKIPIASSCWIVWDKENGDFHTADCELAWTSFDTAVRKVKIKWAGMLQHDIKNKEHRIHPTQKPVKLYEWLLKNYAKEGDKILDTHLGSGSIAIAIHKMNQIEKMNLTLTACELDRDYYNDAIKRIEQQTSQKTIFDET